MSRLDENVRTLCQYLTIMAEACIFKRVKGHRVIPNEIKNYFILEGITVCAITSIMRESTAVVVQGAQKICKNFYIRDFYCLAKEDTIEFAIREAKSQIKEIRQSAKLYDRVYKETHNDICNYIDSQGLININDTLKHNKGSKFINALLHIFTLGRYPSCNYKRNDVD